MPGERTAPSGLASPAEAARLVGGRYRLPPEEARKLVVEGLRSGEVNAVIISVYGERRPATAADFSDAKLDFEIPPEPLTIPAPAPSEGIAESVPAPAPSEGIAESVPALVADAGEPGFSLGVLRVVNPRLEINLLSLWRYAAAILGKSREDIEAARAKDRGGRPTSHDWKRAMRQVLLRVRDYGWPATKGELIAELLDWFGRTYEAAPDESTVRRFVSSIWPQGLCELRPRE